MKRLKRDDEEREAELAEKNVSDCIRHNDTHVVVVDDEDDDIMMMMIMIMMMLMIDLVYNIYTCLSSGATSSS